MHRNWYNINAHNNTFYLVQNNIHHEVQIPPGVYSAFTGAGGLNGAIEAAMQAVIPNMNQVNAVASVFDATTRRYTITFTNTSAQPVTIRAYDCKSGVAPANVTHFKNIFCIFKNSEKGGVDVGVDLPVKKIIFLYF